MAHIGCLSMAIEHARFFYMTGEWNRGTEAEHTGETLRVSKLNF